MNPDTEFPYDQSIFHFFMAHYHFLYHYAKLALRGIDDAPELMERVIETAFQIAQANPLRFIYSDDPSQELMKIMRSVLTDTVKRSQPQLPAQAARAETLVQLRQEQEAEETPELSLTDKSPL